MVTVKGKWTKEIIQDKLRTDRVWLIRGLMAIYQRQTEDEKCQRNTRHENGIGFNKVDSDFLTGMVKFWKDKRFFTDGQYAAVGKCMHKYAGQLAKIANSKI